MRLSELLTIYFAAGASFGVAAYLDKDNGGHFPSLLKAFYAALVWPLTILGFIVRRKEPRSEIANSPAEFSLTTANDRATQARSEVELAIVQVEKMATAVFGSAVKLETLIEALRSTFAQHFHLTIALRQMQDERDPQPRALELCRLAGREGADLEIAASCLHRRSLGHLRARCARAGNDFVHALAELHEATDPARTAPFASVVALRHLSEALLRLDGTALECLSQLEDAAAARSVARLLDAECARTRRLKSLVPQFDLAEEAGGAEWPLPTSRPTLVPPETTLSHG